MKRLQCSLEILGGLNKSHYNIAMQDSCSINKSQQIKLLDDQSQQISPYRVLETQTIEFKGLITTTKSAS